MQKIIDYDVLEDAIAAIEKVIDPFDQVEKGLILRTVSEKINKNKRKDVANDLMAGMNIKDMMKKIYKGDKED